ncbi:MAG: tRNA (adenosine(37)-N6)-threonylcarbamoyltransferase complex dimerization subunit type 1 TsaB [Saprospiraceae bacterium]|nr:tRNA (adenosine(37)-N6)-threonylcarbamoyltransferase complex dimerization subunit type 1 TsaB [Saprospiraceae bacterium]
MADILIIESATEICSVCITRNGEWLAEKENNRPNSHSESLTLLIEQCVKEAGIQYRDLEAIAISDGPGSYTSLRVGAATAKGMCYALRIPLISIDSLTALAYGFQGINYKESFYIIPMIDARRMEVYACVFNSELQRLTETAAIVLDSDSFDFIPDKQKIYLCGSGASKYFDQFGRPEILLGHLSSSARYMATPAFEKFNNRQFENIAYYTPNYLKAPNITKSTKKIF